MSQLKRVLVYGGSGALGEHLVNHFKAKNYWVVSVDMRESKEASVNILVDVSQSLEEQAKSIEQSLSKELTDNKLNAILKPDLKLIEDQDSEGDLCYWAQGTNPSCYWILRGGWAGGNAGSDKFLLNADLMWKQSVWSSLISASLASKHLTESGILTLPGAAAALNATPGMIAYGVAKSAVHQLTKSLAFNEASDDTKSGLPAGTFVAALAPVTLDTPMNRKWMPKADVSSWTPLSFLAELMDKWIESVDQRPPNGSIVKLVTTNNNTDISLY